MSPFEEPSEEVLQMALAIKRLSAEVTYLRGVEAAALHVLRVLAMTSADGVPTFIFSEGQAENTPILQHAILDLQSKMTGSPIPPLALSGRKIH